MRFTASAELTSGFGAPASTATPMLERAMSTRRESLPALIKPSLACAVRMVTSTASPPSTRLTMNDDGVWTMSTLCGLARSNCATSSTMVVRIGAGHISLISAADAAAGRIMARPMVAAKLRTFMTFLTAPAAAT